MTLANFLFRRDDHHNDDSDRDMPSGVATPQPDTSDKRLPGIMHSYFGQVGSGSPSSPSSVPLETPALESVLEHLPLQRIREKMLGNEILSLVTRDSSNEPSSDCSDHKSPEVQSSESPKELGLVAPEKAQNKNLNPYPTPPASHPPSLHKLKLGDSSSEEDETSTSKESSTHHQKGISESIPSSVRRASVMDPLSSVMIASNVHAADFSNPSDRCKDTDSNAPANPSEIHDSPSYNRLKKLTGEFSPQKSTPATPTRALSNQTNKSDGSAGSDPSVPHPPPAKTSTDATPSQSVSSGSSGAGPAAPAPRGKLTVKITEGRGLRRSREPYVVAVFQRNEMVSKGPVEEESDETDELTGSPMMGGIPIMRSGSDSGRPMAIPMKSRQSSNTSTSEYRDFKSKGRKSMTNPKWDTEAAL